MKLRWTYATLIDTYAYIQSSKALLFVLSHRYSWFERVVKSNKTPFLYLVFRQYPRGDKKTCSRYCRTGYRRPFTKNRHAHIPGVRVRVRLARQLGSFITFSGLYNIEICLIFTIIGVSIQYFFFFCYR